MAASAKIANADENHAFAFCYPRASTFVYIKLHPLELEGQTIGNGIGIISLHGKKNNFSS